MPRRRRPASAPCLERFIALPFLRDMPYSAPTNRPHRSNAVRAAWAGGLMTMLLLLAACHRDAGTVLGKAPGGAPRNIVAVRAGDTPPNVTLRGVMVEKCPVAGCWFYLQDDTGIIKVDTKTAGFVVVNVPLQTKITVSGRIISEGEDVSIEGTGLRY